MVVIVLLVLLFALAAWIQGSRAERVEEAIKYEPDPAYPITRFCTAEEMRKRGW